MKIDKSKLMKRAWEIARNAAAKFNESVRSFFSESLKQAWANLKNETLIMGLCEIGNYWAKGNHQRVYFNDLTQYVNVDELSWKHEKAVMAASAYYDCAEKCWYRDNTISEIFSTIRETIERKAKSFNMTIHRKYIETEIEKLEEEIAICY